MTPEKDLTKTDKEKENKDRYLKECLESRLHFNPVVFSTNRIAEKEKRAATQKIALHLRFKLKKKYSGMCRFVRVRMALTVVQYNTLLLRGTRD